MPWVVRSGADWTVPSKSMKRAPVDAAWLEKPRMPGPASTVPSARARPTARSGRREAEPSGKQPAAAGHRRLRVAVVGQHLREVHRHSAGRGPADALGLQLVLVAGRVLVVVVVEAVRDVDAGHRAERPRRQQVADQVVRQPHLEPVAGTGVPRRHRRVRAARGSRRPRSPSGCPRSAPGTTRRGWRAAGGRDRGRSPTPTCAGRCRPDPPARPPT